MTISYQEEHWFKLLQKAVTDSSVTAVSKVLSEGFKQPYSRQAISHIMNGIYRAKPDRIAMRVLEVLDTHANQPL